MTKREAFLWQLSAAVYEPTRVRVNNGRSFEMLNLQRGQLAHSLSYLMDAWQWPSIKRVRTFLERLEQEGFIHRHRGAQTDGAVNKFPPIITICNYDVFLPMRLAERLESEPQRAIKGHTNGQSKGHTN